MDFFVFRILFLQFLYNDLHFFKFYDKIIFSFAGVAELADAPDLGSGISDVQVQVLSSAPYRVFITDSSYGHSIFFCLCLLFG